ncbi:MAG TPA: rRNA adenine dimethyltransferase family protein [Candidatus Paceibacterota bacterium]
MRPNLSTSIKARKSLGQNFLNNPDVVRDILLAADLAVPPPKGGTTADTVLEVGPGEGVLTQALLDAGANIIAVEKDSRLIAPLKQKFPAAHIIEGDILSLDISSLFANCKLQISSFKIVANIPYYITGQFLRKIFGEENLPKRIVLMLQKEVAERIVGGNPTSLKLRGARESLLSISVKAYGTPSIVRYVPRENFEPVPDVDSAVLLIENISRDFFSAKGGPASGWNEQKFFALLRKGFEGKRKQIGKKLGMLGDTRRAEELSLTDWKDLSLQLNTG